MQPNDGPPFNSKEFKELAAEIGFNEKRATPRHPRKKAKWKVLTSS